MSSEKPNFLSQPVVKNIFMFRNGDPYYEARRIVINEKRVCNFETLLREVTGGIQAPFGAVRNIYTPRGGHKVDCLDSLQSGEQYVAAGRERFKRLDYLQIGSRKKKMLQTLPMQQELYSSQLKPLPQNRIIVSARFLKPIKEPCTVFVVANGDVLNPAVRLLIHQRMLGQFDKILEMITEKMGLRVLGGVRSLYTYEGHQVSDGNQLESGQLYVAVGRERFKKLPYSDLLFSKPRGTKRVRGMKAYSLPPIYRFSKQSVNNKSLVRCSDSGDGEFKASPPNHNGTNKEHLSSIVREISQARLLSMRKRRSGQSLTLDTAENDDQESKAEDGSTDGKPLQDQPDKAKLDTDDAKEENGGGKAEEKEEAASENTTEEEASTSQEDKKEEEKTNSEQEEGEEKKESEGEEATAADEQKVEEVKEEVKEDITDESKEEVQSEEKGSSSDKDSKEKQEGSHTSSEGEKEQDKDTEEEKKDSGDDGEGEKSSKDNANDVDTGEEVKESENSSDPEKTEPDSETKESDNGSSSNSNQEEEDVSKIKDEQPEERKVNGEVSREDDGVESEAELDMKEKNSSGTKDATVNGEKGEEEYKESQDKSRKAKH